MILPVHIPQQEMGNWCWAAVTAGVHEYLRGAAVRQCAIAEAVLGASCCVQPQACDRQQRLDAALARFGCLAGPPLPSPLTPAALIQQIEGLHRPVCCHIQWPNGGPLHFIAVTGWKGGTIFTVQDPLRPEKDYEYAALAHMYAGAGVWDFTYLTA